MEYVGEKNSKWFTSENLQHVKSLFEKEGYLCKLYNLNEEIKKLKSGLFNIDSEILVIKNDVELFAIVMNYLII